MPFDDDRPTPPISEIDVTVPLAGLKAGAYVLRLVASDDAHSSRQDTEIHVVNDLL